MSLKFPISLVGKRGSGFPLGDPTNYWDLDDSSYTNQVDATRNLLATGTGSPVIESNTAPDGGGCTVTNTTDSLVKTVTGTPQITLSLWVEFVIEPPRYTPFLCWRNSQVNGTYLMLGRPYNGGGQVFNMHGEQNRSVANQSVSQGWVHWLLTYDGNTMRAYKNGVSQGTASYTCSVCTRSRPFRLGRNWGSNHHPCKFSMLGIWDVAPADESEAQATADYLYNGGIGRRFANL